MFGKSPPLLELAASTGQSEARLCIRWLLQKGFVTIPKSVQRERIISNACFDFELSAEQVRGAISRSRPWCRDAFGLTCPRDLPYPAHCVVDGRHGHHRRGLQGEQRLQLYEHAVGRGQVNRCAVPIICQAHRFSLMTACAASCSCSVLASCLVIVGLHACEIIGHIGVMPTTAARAQAHVLVSC